MSNIVFKRKIYDKMLEWKHSSKGKTALLIEGARRVGKSTIVREFATKEYKSCILVDFNNTSEVIKHLFDDLMDLNGLFLYLQTAYNIVLYPRESVIVFDEVQNCPKARQAIKYLVADGRYDYIETGSLISIHKNTVNITIPSEERRLQLYPLDYEEFRWAMGDVATLPLLSQFWNNKCPLGAIHRLKMREMRLYLLVGGMPQAVCEYLESNNFQKVDEVKRDIIRLYIDDFRKIDSYGRISKMFISIPSLLSQNASRYVPYSVVGNQDAEKMVELLRDLEDSKTVNFVYHCDDPSVGMNLNRDLDRFKLFLSDTGLFITLVFWDKDFSDNIIYEKMLSDKLPVNFGYIYKNLVAQILVASGNNLFYYTWKKDERHNYVVDFLLSRGNKICPIEVKSSGYNAHASLDAFCQKFSSRISSRYLVYTKDLQKDGETQLLPMYLVPFI